MQRNPSSRKAVNLSQPLHKKIDLYALAAGAAGVGMMVLAHPAQAEIVYTKTNESFNIPNIYSIDINNDGTPDFQFQLATAATSFGGPEDLGIARASYAPASNGVVAAPVGKFTDAFALPAGQEIGPHRNFLAGGLVVGNYYNVYRRSDPVLRWYGQWANEGKGLGNRYIGVKFLVDNEIHYGWIRISVTTNKAVFSTTMTGYAYETVANKPILAGATKESDEEKSSAAVETPASEPPTLGVLALGAPGLSIWRGNN
jgi:hypothetical protein